MGESHLVTLFREGGSLLFPWGYIPARNIPFH